MRPLVCPRCGEIELAAVGDGYYRCESCGYVGLLGFNQDIFKKI
jgi:tRNA(Ile2) C34 agmatinyltransferase TiaS